MQVTVSGFFMGACKRRVVPLGVRVGSLFTSTEQGRMGHRVGQHCAPLGE